MSRQTVLVSLALASAALAQTYSATYLPGNAPKTSEKGQSGTNQCGSGNDQSSMCQNVYVNSLEDFCLFAPPNPGAGSVIGNTERIEVAWCVQGGHGTRVMPAGTVKGAHFVQTPDYVQVTGVGDFTKINIPAGDEGGELDPHGADGNGNPIGGLVFSNAYGDYMQMHEWTNFMAYNEFCIRACKDGPDAPRLCQHIYDVMGCAWNMPGDYSAGSFDSCRGDSGEPMGVYGTSTFHQGQPSTPAAHPAPAKSQCVNANTVGDGMQATAPGVPATTTTSISSSHAATSTSAISSTSASASGSASPSSGSASGSATNSGSASGTASMTTSRAAAGGSVSATSPAKGSTATSATPSGSSASSSVSTATSSSTAGANGGTSGAAALGRGLGLGLELAVAGVAVVVGALVA